MPSRDGDDNAAKCHNCLVRFTSLGCWRHHCRACKHSYCDTCSAQRAQLAGAPSEAPAVRHCSACFQARFDGGGGSEGGPAAAQPVAEHRDPSQTREHCSRLTSSVLSQLRQLRDAGCGRRFKDQMNEFAVTALELLDEIGMPPGLDDSGLDCITCHVCYELYGKGSHRNAPAMLTTCGHTLCRTCVVRCGSACPFCMTAFYAVEAGAGGDVMDNHAIADVAEAVLSHTVARTGRLHVATDQLLPRQGEPQVVPRRAWLPDNASTNCTHCAKAFSLTRRKHHCRWCGTLVCHACSPRCNQTEDDGKMARCCTRCDDKIRFQAAFRSAAANIM